MPNEHDGKEYLKKKEAELTDFGKYLLQSVYKENGKVEVYGKILPTEEDKVEEISIVSQLMIDYDRKFFDNKPLPDKLDSKEYHPYCCEFIINLSSVTKKWQKCLKNNVGKWLKITLAFGSSNDSKRMLQGMLIFSASPIIRKWCGLICSYVLNFDDNTKIIEDSDIKEYDAFAWFLDGEHKQEKTHSQIQLFEDVKMIDCLSGEIYNVGQGNFIYLKINNRYSMFFDVGESKNPQGQLGENYYIQKNENQIANLKPDYIMLSHWDLDHILGVYKFNDKPAFSFYESPKWIVPDIAKIGKNVSLSAKRLCAYLFKVGDIIFIDSPNDCFCTVGSNNNEGMLRFWQGDCKATLGSLANNIGLIIEAQVFVNEISETRETTYGAEIRPGYQKLLFTGDCSYWHVNPVVFLEKYDFIVTAHHGAASAVEYDLMFLAPDAEKGARAVISTGCNSDKHPHIEHLTELKYRGFDVYYTTGCQYIEFNISNKKRLKMQRCFEKNKE